MTTRMPHWRGWPLLANAIKIEEYPDHDDYVIRAEVPGADPAAEVSVMIADGEVTIEVTRPEPVPERSGSEFHYGRQTRTVMLPRRARDETASAVCGNDGVLEVRVKMTRSAAIGRPIPIAVHRAGTSTVPTRRN